MSLSASDQYAFELIKQCKPQWSGLCKVSDVIGERQLLLHAGPPFSSTDLIPTPIMNSLVIGAVWEGWAMDYAQARQMILAKEISVASAQDHDIVVPLAGVVSPSMTLMIIQNANQPAKRKYSVLNEGMVHCTRLGKLDETLLGHLSWLNGELACWLTTRLVQPIDLLPVINAALADGDDCHGRTIVSSALLHQRLADMSKESIPTEINDFLQQSLAFALNVWMAACCLMMSAAEGVVGSSLVTKAAGNGIEFGIQLAAAPGKWVTTAAPAINGAIDPSHQGRTALGALGDSAVVDFMGLGGQVLNTAHASREALGNYLPGNALQRPIMALAAALPGFEQRLAVTCARNVVASGAGPLTLLGMIEDKGEAGRIGGGVADAPVSLFERALQEAGL
ncbi:oxamate carbamoyltransferase subunit AllG family protein [Oceanisphaera ostreae]|uniref:DUF1116 domain-containing protein n=1 Tax=Oceanisphaera ostreae TaxID=914151 RepID=A0ABW3KN08_9GAMM